MMSISAKSCEEDEKVYGTVNTKIAALNIRASPSENAQVVEKAEKDSTLQILDDSKKWYKVRLPNGKVGYARGDYLKVMKRVPLIEGTYGLVATQLLNIREGPGAKYQEVVRAPENTKLQILCDLGDWYKVQDEEGVRVGYANSKYITLRQPLRSLSKPPACSVTSEERLDELLEEVTTIYGKPGCKNIVRQRLNAILNEE
jgi:uncharacterized protein YgiM (DUF1202 family)